MHCSKCSQFNIWVWFSAPAPLIKAPPQTPALKTPPCCPDVSTSLSLAAAQMITRPLSLSLSWVIYSCEASWHSYICWCPRKDKETQLQWQQSECLYECQLFAQTQRDESHLTSHQASISQQPAHKCGLVNEKSGWGGARDVGGLDFEKRACVFACGARGHEDETNSGEPTDVLARTACWEWRSVDAVEL